MIPTQTVVASLYAQHDWSSIKKIYIDTLKMFSFLCGLLTFILSVLIERVSIIWVGFYNIEISRFSLILLIGQSIAILTTAIGVSISTGIGRRGIETTYIVINLILNILALYFFTIFWGSIGAILATSLTWAFSGFIFLIILHNKVDLPVSASVQLLYSIIINFFLILFFRIIIMQIPIGNNRLDALIFSLLSLLIVLPIYYYTNKAFNLVPDEISTKLSKIIETVFGQANLWKYKKNRSL
jgi:O-antigen/teichoic acid export membrane protein